MSEAVIAEGVSLRPGRGRRSRTVVSGLDLTVDYGSITVLAGPSGAGKTTTLRAIVGGLPAFEGRIRVLGWDLQHLSSRRMAAVRRRIGVVPQNPALGQGRSVRETLEEALYATGSGGPTGSARVAEALELTGTSHTLRQNVSVLSAGEARRVGMARALVIRPDLLLLDEPTSNLDASAAETTIDIIATAAAAGLAVLVATHDPRLAEVADRTVHLPKDPG